MNYSDIPEAEKKVYVMLHKKDGGTYVMTLLATLCNLIYVISILDVMPVSFWMGCTTIMNIFLLFLLFLCAVRMNVYMSEWARIGLIVGAYMVLRAFVLVPFLLQPYDREIRITAVNLAGAALLFCAGIRSIRKSRQRQALQDKLAQTGQIG